MCYYFSLFCERTGINYAGKKYARHRLFASRWWMHAHTHTQAQLFPRHKGDFCRFALRPSIYPNDVDDCVHGVPAPQYLRVFSKRTNCIAHNHSTYSILQWNSRCSRPNRQLHTHTRPPFSLRFLTQEKAHIVEESRVKSMRRNRIGRVVL